MRKPNDSDVYPLSVTYNDKQKLKMKIIRITTFILCFYFIIPFDLYIQSDHRLYFYGTLRNEDRFTFNFSDPDYNITFHLENCRVGLYADYDN